ncbi:MAG: hypothetical protein CVV15_12215, partial [Gammaproteobacteria bacterium HGW-Gammaproteobacteria-5]
MITVAAMIVLGKYILVIQAQAGIQCAFDLQRKFNMDPSFRWGDDLSRDSLTAQIRVGFIRAGRPR